MSSALAVHKPPQRLADIAWQRLLQILEGRAAQLTIVGLEASIGDLQRLAQQHQRQQREDVRQTLIRIIVEERALVTSALGMSAMVFNVGRMLGPAIAGIVLAYLSEAWCFALNAMSYAAIIAALLAMVLDSRVSNAASPHRSSSK